LEDIQVLVRVYPFERDAGGRRSFACVGKRLQQHGQPFSGFRMPERRMKPCERRMRQDVDSAATRSASALSPSPRTKTDASAHFAVGLFRGGKGAEASSVAIRRYIRSSSA